MLTPTESNLKELLLGVVFVILFLAISIVLFFIIYQKRLFDGQLRLKALENDYQKQLLSSSIDAQEKERIRIGHDLHDQIGSSLSAVKMLVGQVIGHDDEDKQLISGITLELTNTIKDVRNIANNLFPSVLAKFGLVEALQHLKNILSTGSEILIDLITDEAFTLSFEQELAIYRIIQELANNTLKHANPKSLHISLRNYNSKLLLSVIDDGCGFDTDTVVDLKQMGIGLKSIQTRVAVLHAEITIQSAPGKGTSIEIIIPYNN